MIDCKDNKFSRVLHDLNENLSFGQIWPKCTKNSHFSPNWITFLYFKLWPRHSSRVWLKHFIFSRKKKFQILKLPTSILEKKWKSRKSHILAYFTYTSTHPKEVGNFTNFFHHFVQDYPSNLFYVIIGQTKLPTSVKQALFHYYWFFSKIWLKLTILVPLNIICHSVLGFAVMNP